MHCSRQSRYFKTLACLFTGLQVTVFRYCIRVLEWLLLGIMFEGRWVVATNVGFRYAKTNQSEQIDALEA